MNGSARNQQDQQERQGGKKKRIALAIALVVLLALGGCAAWKAGQPQAIDEVTGGWFYDQSAADIQEAIDHEVEDGYFNMSINTSVPVATDGTALIGIKNIDTNRYDCIVTITLEDGTEVYKSGGIAPGTELRSVTLNQELQSGEYEGTALFEIFERDEAHTKAGQVASKVTFYVQ